LLTALNKVDFPTLGNPTMPAFKAMFLYVIFNCCVKAEKLKA
jgi:hypothetical protein